MLILTLVCVAWLEIIGIQSARKEARRREAVERLSGMMDAFMSDSLMAKEAAKIFSINKKTKKKTYTCGYYRLNSSSLVIDNANPAEIIPLYENEISPIGYRMRLLKTTDLDNKSEYGSNWTDYERSSAGYWLVGELFDHNGKKEDHWKPFFTLSAFLGL